MRIRTGTVVILAGIVVGLAGALGSPKVVLMLAIILAGLTVSAVVSTLLGIERLILVVMVVNAFLVPMNSLRLGPLMNVSDVFLIIAAPLVLTTRLYHPGGHLPTAYRRYLSSLALIAVGGFLATVVAADMSSLPGVLRFALSTMGVVWIVALWAPDSRSVRVLLWAFVLGAGLSAAVGLQGSELFAGRSIGLANHPNHYGAICDLSAGGAIALAITSTHRYGRRVASALAALSAIGVVLSGSRSALLALVFGGAALLVALRSFRFVLRGAIIGLLVVAGLTVAGPSLPKLNALERLFSTSPYVEQSNVERTDKLVEARAQIEERPFFGSGFRFALVAHSLYIQLWVSAGLLGLIGICRIVYWSGRYLQRGRQDRFFVAMMAGFVGFLANAAFNAILWDRYIWTFLALALAAAPAIHAQTLFRTSSPGDASEVPPRHLSTFPLG